MGARLDQAKFVAGYLREKARFGFGAQVLRDPLCRLHTDEGRLDPYPLYRTIRGRGPLSRSTAGAWVSATHAVCHQVLRDRRLGVSGRDDGTEETPPLSFLDMDPPDHTRLRRFALPSFSPRSIVAFEPKITGIIDGLLDAVDPTEPFDLVSALAAPMPIGVITTLLGVPDADAAEFAAYGTTFGSALGGLQSLAHARELQHARHRLQRLFAGLLEVKRGEPGEDVISRVIADSGGTVRAEEFVPLCTLLLIAGFETTVNLIGNTTLALLDHPEAWRRVVEDPSLAEAAVEETLRFDSPVQRTARTAREDLELGGQRVRKGDFVVVLVGGANRDPAVFADPDRFDLDRDAREHLAFSGGIHYCVGAPLARLEATLAVRALVARFPDLQQVGPLQRRPGSLIRGMSSFIVRGQGPVRLAR